MARLELHFTGKELPALQKVFFSHPLLPSERMSVRGKTAGAFSSPYSFQWTQAVIALAYFLVRCRVHYLLDSEEPVLLAGEGGSPAASLDYSVAKGPRWTHDMFGTDNQGLTLLRRLLIRTNPERRREGPVVIALNGSQLSPENFRIYLNGEEPNLTELMALATGINEAFFALSGTTSPPVPRVQPPESSRGASATEMFLSMNCRRLHFRDEWLPILSGLITDTREVIRGTVLDTEVDKWWRTVPGQIYLCTNLLLLRRSVSIKRLFLVTSDDEMTLRSTVLNAYIQEQLGIKVSIARLESLPYRPLLRSPMLSVHDSHFAAIHSPADDSPETDIEIRSSSVQELSSLYDQFLEDDSISTPVGAYLRSVDVSSSAFRRANDAVSRLRDVGKLSSLAEIVAHHSSKD